MNTLVCADLDRTLIYSAAALELTMADTDAPQLLCVEVYQQTPLSFMRLDAAQELLALADAAVLVPTTTRTPEQYARVHLPGRVPPFAITANGGRLLVDGELDGDWSGYVTDLLSTSAALAEVLDHLRQPREFLLNVRAAANLFAYAVVERAQLPAEWVAELMDWCTPRGWTVSVQGRKVYCVPHELQKSTAAREVQRRTGCRQLLAAGDSLLDADLLSAADLGVHPAHGELSATGWSAAHVHRTRTSGVAAGAEIVHWLTTQVVR